MIDEKRRKIDPFDYSNAYERVKTISQTPEASSYVSNKLNTFYGYGIKTSTSDNIKDVINYEFSRQSEDLQRRKQHSQYSLQSSQLKRPRKTKASELRDKAIKMNQDSLLTIKNSKKLFKLKQFINVPSSQYFKGLKMKHKAIREDQYKDDMNNLILQSPDYNTSENARVERGKLISLSNAAHNKTINGGFPHLRNKSIGENSSYSRRLKIDKMMVDSQVNRSLANPNLQKSYDLSNLKLHNSKQKNIDHVTRLMHPDEENDRYNYGLRDAGMHTFTAKFSEHSLLLEINDSNFSLSTLQFSLSLNHKLND